LASKPVATVSPGLNSKQVATVFRFGLKTGGDGFPVWHQNRWRRFDDLCLKITATVFWFVPQNQVDDGLSVAPQN
jgi:hypothetical protein